MSSESILTLPIPRCSDFGIEEHEVSEAEIGLWIELYKATQEALVLEEPMTPQEWLDTTQYHEELESIVREIMRDEHPIRIIATLLMPVSIIGSIGTFLLAMEPLASLIYDGQWSWSGSLIGFLISFGIVAIMLTGLGGYIYDKLPSFSPKVKHRFYQFIERQWEAKHPGYMTDIFVEVTKMCSNCDDLDERLREKIGSDVFTRLDETTGG